MHFSVNGVLVSTLSLPQSVREVCPAACFGGSNQVLSIVDTGQVGRLKQEQGAEPALEEALAGGGGAAVTSIASHFQGTWDAEHLGPDMQLSNERTTLTRVDGSGWGIQMSDAKWSSGRHRMDVQVSSTIINHHFISLEPAFWATLPLCSTLDCAAGGSKEG